MKRNYRLSMIVVAFILSACASTKKSTGVWVNEEKLKGKTFTSVFVIVLTADVQARVKLEGDLVNAAIARGFKAVKSIDLLPVDLKDPKIPTKEEVMNKLKESGCDAVFVATLLKEDEAIRYVPSSTTYTIMPYYTWTGNFFGYYSNISTTVSTSSYYSADKTYFMMSNLYDVASQEIMWSVQSEVFKPSSLNSFSRSYTTTLLSQLDKDKVMKKVRK